MMNNDRPLLYSLAPFLLLIFFAAPIFAAENLTFYDWQVHIQSRQNKPTACFIQLTGFNREKRVLLDVNLSVSIETAPLHGRKATTILRIKADRINKPDLSDLSPLKIHDAWMTTSLGSSAGEMAKIDVGSDPHYLGGKAGTDLFHQLLQGILKDGATIGLRERPDDSGIASTVPAPPPEVVIQKLMPCLAAVLPDQDLPA